MTSTDLDLSSVRDRRLGVEEFLYAEAALLDDRDFGAWLKLFTPDALYWIPSGLDDADPTRQVSIVYDDIKFLSERVWRLNSGLAYAQQPPSRTVHMVNNVRIVALEQDETGDVLGVDAAFIVTEFRRGGLYTHSGRYHYRLLSHAGAFWIRQKKIELINNDGYLGNLSLLL